MRKVVKRLFAIMLVLVVAFTLIPNLGFLGGVGAYAAESSNSTGFAKRDGQWVFIRNGKPDYTYTGLAKSIYTDEIYFATKGKFDPKYTGIYKFRDTFYAVIKGKVDLSFTGVVPNEKGGWYFTRKGVYDTTYTGLARQANSNIIRYVKDGVFRKYTGIYKFEGTYYAVKDGIVDRKFTGVVPNEKEGWYFTRKGVYDTGYTGLAKQVNSNNIRYVKGGVFKKYTGIHKYQDTFYSVIDGLVNKSFTGVIKNENGVWCFVRKGVYDTSYTGLAKQYNSDNILYVKNGKWVNTYTGIHKFNDVFYAVIKGKVDKSFTGVIKNEKGTWCFVRKGVYDPSYTGLAKQYNSSDLLYVKNGSWDKSYTGVHKFQDAYYAVVKGKVDKTFTGVLQNEKGSWHFLRKGVYDQSYTGLAQQYSSENIRYVDKGDFKKYDGIHKFKDVYYGVRSGLVDLKYTGLSQNTDTKKWYFVRDGVYDTSYTGLVETDGDYFYVVNGAHQESYDGPAQKEGDDTWYHVSNGWLDTSYNGNFDDGTNDYNVDDGVIVKSRVNYRGVKFYVDNNGVEGQDPYTRPPRAGRGNPSVIEISISEQHMWYYEYGEVIISTDVITGNPNAGRLATPVGWDYVHSKSRDLRLVGSDYNVHVDYWIGIDRTGYYGIHDASWRNGVFGGNIYTYSPSHGCVNTPYYAMQELYSEVSVGYTDVYVYW